MARGDRLQGEGAEPASIWISLCPEPMAIRAAVTPPSAHSGQEPQGLLVASHPPFSQQGCTFTACHKSLVLLGRGEEPQEPCPASGLYTS